MIDERGCTLVDTSSEAAFRQFVPMVEPQLRTALVGVYGPDRGVEATAEALAFAWEHWDRVKGLSNPAGYLYRVGQSRTRPRKTRTLFYRPEVSRAVDRAGSGCGPQEPASGAAGRGGPRVRCRVHQYGSRRDAGHIRFDSKDEHQARLGQPATFAGGDGQMTHEDDVLRESLLTMIGESSPSVTADQALERSRSGGVHTD